jgi:hypothetical protein
MLTRAADNLLRFRNRSPTRNALHAGPPRRHATGSQSVHSAHFLRISAGLH